jgi:hypothetical protein
VDPAWDRPSHPSPGVVVTRCGYELMYVPPERLADNEWPGSVCVLCSVCLYCACKYVMISQPSLSAALPYPSLSPTETPASTLGAYTHPSPYLDSEARVER